MLWRVLSVCKKIPLQAQPSTSPSDLNRLLGWDFFTIRLCKTPA